MNETNDPTCRLKPQSTLPGTRAPHLPSPDPITEAEIEAARARPIFSDREAVYDGYTHSLKQREGDLTGPARDKAFLSTIEHALDLRSGLAPLLRASADRASFERSRSIRHGLPRLKLLFSVDRKRLNHPEKLRKKRKVAARWLLGNARSMRTALKEPGASRLGEHRHVLQAVVRLWVEIEAALEAILVSPAEYVPLEALRAVEGLVLEACEVMARELPALTIVDQLALARYAIAAHPTGHDRDVLGVLFDKLSDRIADGWLMQRSDRLALKRLAKEQGISPEEMKRELCRAALRAVLEQTDRDRPVILNEKGVVRPPRWVAIEAKGSQEYGDRVRRCQLPDSPDRELVAGVPVRRLRPSEDLLPEEYWRHVETRTKTMAEKLLRTEAGPPSEEVDLSSNLELSIVESLESDGGSDSGGGDDSRGRREIDELLDDQPLHKHRPDYAFEEREQLARALELAAPQARQLIMAYRETGTWVAAAELVGIPEKQAHSQMSRLRRKLKTDPLIIELRSPS